MVLIEKFSFFDLFDTRFVVGRYYYIVQ